MAHKLKSPRIAEDFYAIQQGAYGQIELITGGTAASTAGQYFGRIFAQNAVVVDYSSVDFEGTVSVALTGVIIPAGAHIDGLFTSITVTTGKIICNRASVDE